MFSMFLESGGCELFFLSVLFHRKKFLELLRNRESMENKTVQPPLILQMRSLRSRNKNMIWARNLLSLRISI